MLPRPNSSRSGNQEPHMLKAKPLTIAAVATFAALASLSAQAKDLRVG